MVGAQPEPARAMLTQKRAAASTMSLAADVNRKEPLNQLPTAHWNWQSSQGYLAAAVWGFLR